MLTTNRHLSPKSTRSSTRQYLRTISLWGIHYLSPLQPHRRKPQTHNLNSFYYNCFRCFFTLLQASEYYEASFTISDGVYVSTFFIAIGFHRLHVIIGSTFLIVCLLCQLKHHFTSNHHLVFKATA